MRRRILTQREIIVGAIIEREANHYHSLRRIDLHTADAMVIVGFAIQMAVLIWLRSEKGHKLTP